MLASLPESPDDHELDVLTRRYSGLVRQRRLEAFGERLSRGSSVAVERSSCGFSGNRWELGFDDGSTLRLKLYWPQRAHAREVCSVNWVDNVGWRVVVRTHDGRTVLLHAFQAELRPPQPAV